MSNTGSFSGGLEYVGVAPYMNFYSSSWGIGVKNIYLSQIQTYNGFSNQSEKYFSNWYGRFDTTKMLTGGMSIDRTTGRCGFYLYGKRTISGIVSDLNHIMDIYFDTQSGPAYVTKFTIKRNFVFDELE